MSEIANIVERLKTFLANPPPNEDGESYELVLLPAISSLKIAALEQELGCPLSSEIKELLEHCGGIDGGALDAMTFIGQEALYAYPPSLRQRFREFAMDGFGNFWFYWTPITSNALGPVYYYMHEGPMLLYQSASLVDFIDEWMRFMTPPYKSLIDDVHEFRLKPIKELNRDLLDRTSIMSGSDRILKEFVQALSDDVLVYDFRQAKIGDGVDLMRMDLVAAHDHHPILAVRKRDGWKWLKAFFMGKR